MEPLVSGERLQSVSHHGQGVPGRVPLGHDVGLKAVSDPLPREIRCRVENDPQRKLDCERDVCQARHESMLALSSTVAIAGPETAAEARVRLEAVPALGAHPRAG